VRLRVRANDQPAGSIVEALIDDIRIFDVETPIEPTIVGFALEANRPNPFLGKTVIPYAVPAPGSVVHIRVYRVDGRLVRTLLSEHVEPGLHNIAWDGRDHQGLRAASGIYLVQMTTPQANLTRKVFFLR